MCRYSDIIYTVYVTAHKRPPMDLASIGNDVALRPATISGLVVKTLLT